MNIILEGFDRNGKTTLSSLLKNNLENVKYTHFTAPKKVLKEGDIVLTPGVSVFWQINKFVKNNLINDTINNINRIYDRFIYSDIVYGPIYRNSGDIMVGLPEKKYMELVMKTANTVIIHCKLDDEDKNWELLVEEGEGLITRETLTKCRKLYTELLDNSNLPVFNYDFTKHTITDVLDWITEQEEKYNEDKANHKDAYNYFIKGKYIGALSNFDKNSLIDKEILLFPSNKINPLLIKTTTKDRISFEDYMDCIIKSPYILQLNNFSMFKNAYNINKNHTQKVLKV